MGEVGKITFLRCVAFLSGGARVPSLQPRRKPQPVEMSRRR